MVFADLTVFRDEYGTSSLNAFDDSLFLSLSPGALAPVSPVVAAALHPVVAHGGADVGIAEALFGGPWAAVGQSTLGQRCVVEAAHDHEGTRIVHSAGDARPCSCTTMLTGLGNCDTTSSVAEVGRPTHEIDGVDLVASQDHLVFDYVGQDFSAEAGDTFFVPSVTSTSTSNVFAWEDCDDFVPPDFEREVPCVFYCWDDTDDLAAPWCNQWLNPKFYPWNGGSTARLAPSSTKLYLALGKRCGVSQSAMSRFANWKKRAVTRISSTTADRARWRRYRAACRCVQQQVNFRAKCSDCTKGLRFKEREDSWLADCANLGVDACILSVSNKIAREYAHVSGDGNCLWRAVWAATAAAPNWRQLKEKILRPHLSLSQYRPFGVLAGAVCYAAIANFFGKSIHVELKESVVCFNPAGVKECSSIFLRVVNNHAQPACPASATAARRAVHDVSLSLSPVRSLASCVDLGSVADLSHEHVSPCPAITARHLVSGGKDPDRVHPCMILNYKRSRTLRCNVHVDSNPSFGLFIDRDTPRSLLATKIALHLGMDSERVHVRKQHGVLCAFCKTTHLTHDQFQAIKRFAMRTPLGRQSRSVQGQCVEAFLGHRATRLRGLLKTTHLVAAPVLARAMQCLTEVLPNFCFTSVGVIWHGNIPLHTDSKTCEKAAMTTLLGSDSYLLTTSPVDGKPVSACTSGRVVVFNPLLPHAVRVDSACPCLSIVGYSTSRAVHDQEAINLRALGFPIRAARDIEIPTNFTLSPSDSTESNTGDDFASSCASLNSPVTDGSSSRSVSEPSMGCDESAPAVAQNQVVISPTLPWELLSGVSMNHVFLPSDMWTSTRNMLMDQHDCSGAGIVISTTLSWELPSGACVVNAVKTYDMWTSTCDVLKGQHVCSVVVVHVGCGTCGVCDLGNDSDIDCACGSSCSCPWTPMNIPASHLVSGTIENAELSRLAQRVKDAQ
eukprot:6491911-Amphidinium_carterae.1